MMHEWVPCHSEAANHQLPIALAFWIIRIVSMEECSSFSQNFMQFRCSTHSAILNAAATQYTQQSLQPPLTSTVKSSLFTHVHSSPLSLAARLHWCHSNCSHYINNGWTFSRQTSYSPSLRCCRNWHLRHRLNENKNVMWLTKVFLTKLRHRYLNNNMIAEVISTILEDVEAYILVKNIRWLTFLHYSMFLCTNCILHYSLSGEYYWSFITFHFYVIKY